MTNNNDVPGAEGGSMALPWSQEGWIAQVLRHYLEKYLPAVAKITDDMINRWLIGLLAFSMIVYPVTKFAENLRAGVLLISPPLILMLLAGVVGIGLSRPPRVQVVVQRPTIAEAGGELGSNERYRS